MSQKLVVATKMLQELVSKSVKGASSNKMIPLTSLMAIRLKDNTLTLITSDATNVLYVKQDKVEGEDFYVVVPVDIFYRLTAKMNSEKITLTLNEDSLEVVGNGKYTIELPLDEEGQLIVFPDPLAELELTAETGIIHLSTVNVILNTAKAALATSLEMPWFTGYYAGHKVITTDTYKICGLDVKLFETPVLINAECMNLLKLMSSENIKAFVFDNILVFDTPECTVYSQQLPDIENFPVETIDNLIEQSFESSCKLPKNELLQVLDRVKLFIGKYDQNAIYMTFTKDGLSLSSKKSSGVELIKYADSKNFKDFTCCVDIDMFSSQIEANAADTIELYYGETNAIKLVDGNITQVVALADDDRLEV